MARFSELSIRQRIWLVLSLAIAPLFILTVSDYFVEREQRLARFANDARLMLNGVLIAEIEQHWVSIPPLRHRRLLRQR